MKLAMPWFETFWHANRRFPTDGEIMEHFGSTLSQTKLLTTHKFFLHCLDSRGIQRPDRLEFHLTDRQVAAIAILTNFNSVKAPAIKLAEIGVSEEELHGWYKNPYFQNALRDRADSILDDVSSDATAELARSIKKGYFPAIKFYYEITGRAQSPEAVNVKQAMTVLIEAVQKHVKDPEVLQAIAEEVQTLRAIKGL